MRVACRVTEWWRGVLITWPVCLSSHHLLAFNDDDQSPAHPWTLILTHPSGIIPLHLTSSLTATFSLCFRSSFHPQLILLLGSTLKIFPHIHYLAWLHQKKKVVQVLPILIEKFPMTMSMSHLSSARRAVKIFQTFPIRRRNTPVCIITPWIFHSS